jgi:hypothetical protein
MVASRPINDARICLRRVLVLRLGLHLPTANRASNARRLPTCVPAVLRDVPRALGSAVGSELSIATYAGGRAGRARMKPVDTK